MILSIARSGKSGSAPAAFEPEQDPYYIHYCRVNFDGTGLVVLTAGDGTHEVEFSPDRTFLIDSYSRVDMAPVVELRRSRRWQPGLRPGKSRPPRN